MMIKEFPCLETGNNKIDKAFRISIGDLAGNIIPHKAGILDNAKPVIMAGLEYDRPWTRDAAINVWNGAGLLFPEASLNTLLSVLKNVEGEPMINGQYWDSVIWVIGAWWQYLYTGDKEFLYIAFKAIKNTLEFFESAEFDASKNLFYGPACYGDGVSAYPDIYANDENSFCIMDWTYNNPDLINMSKSEYGLPMHSLSTNCLYYYAYLLTGNMANELDNEGEAIWMEKAKTLKKAINTHFWNDKTGCYRYLVDPFGDCEHQEGMGNSFAILFNIADKAKVEKIFSSQYITPSGISCLWPTFNRYKKDYHSYGRHSGTVWPHIQAFWASAAAMHNKIELFEFELRKLAEHAVRDGYFAEVYHPISGEVYGGIQEPELENAWISGQRQTWSATGFIRMILMGLFGMSFLENGIKFNPTLPKDINRAVIRSLPYRNMMLEIQIEGCGNNISDFKINGQESASKVDLTPQN